MSSDLATDELIEAVREWRAEGAVLVLAAGCWDPLHAGHVEHLEAAARLGNALIVAVASDRMVKEHKTVPGGPVRPFLPAAERARIVGALRCVDAAVVNDDTERLIDLIRPHVYVKGEEYRGRLTPDLTAELERLELYGGRLAFVSGETVRSSSALLAGVKG